MKKILSAVLTILFIFSMISGTAMAETSTYETEIANQANKGSSGDAFQVEMTPVVSEDKKTLTLTVQVDNFKESYQLVILELILHYDTTRLTNITSKSDEGTYNCITSSLPGTDWENLVADYTKDPQCISIAVGVASDLTQHLKSNSKLTFEFKFEIKDGFDEAGFWITNERSRSFDKDFNARFGKGQYAIAKIITPNNCIHEYEHIITPPTYTEKGFTTHICKICKHSYVDTYVDPITQGLLGDVNGDGTVNAKDYLMLKRHILGTYTIDSQLSVNGDMDRDGDLKAKDYLILKRTVLGTYNPT